MQSDMPNQQSRLRQQMRHKRQQLSRFQVINAAHRLAVNLAQHSAIQQARRIALYVGFDNELDPWQSRYLWERHKSLWLPTLHRPIRGQLQFLDAYSQWKTNRFGISEPVYRADKICPVWQLDVILMPLTAFDRNGGRVGMGGGFYDRTLAALPSWGIRPTCIGVGYRFQEQTEIALNDWDQPLDGVVTD